MSKSDLTNNNINKRNRKLVYITKTAILTAMAAALMVLDFNLPLMPDIYKMDLSEVPILLGGFSMGPLSALIMELIKTLLNFALNGTVTGGIGEISNFLIGSSFTVTASLVYKKIKTKKGAVASLFAGTSAITLFGVLLNYYILIPVYAEKFFGSDINALLCQLSGGRLTLSEFVLLFTLPFNALKGIVSSLIVFFLYKRLSRYLHL